MPRIVGGFGHCLRHLTWVCRLISEFDLLLLPRWATADDDDESLQVGTNAILTVPHSNELGGHANYSRSV